MRSPMPHVGIPLKPGRLEQLRLGRPDLPRQRDVAEKIGVTLKSYTNWISGQTDPTLENIVALAELFRVQPKDLVLKGHMPAEPIRTTPERLDVIEQLMAALPRQVEVGFVEFRAHVQDMTRKLDLILDHFGIPDALSDPYGGVGPDGDPGEQGDAGESPSAPDARDEHRTG